MFLRLLGHGGQAHVAGDHLIEHSVQQAVQQATGRP
jgi:hypothetical protein